MRSGLIAGLLVMACQAAPTAEECLVPLVRDEDRGVRYAAVMALGKAGVGEAALADAFRDPEWCVRAEAAVALARVGPRALPIALAAASDPDRDVRLEAWTALRKMGPEALRAGHAVLRAWSDDPDRRVHTLALQLLLRVGDPPSAEKLIGVVDGWTDHELLARTRAPAIERFLVEQAEARTRGARDGLLEYLGIRSWIFPEEATVDVERLRMGEAVPYLLDRLEKAEESKVYPELGLVRDPRVLEWLRAERRARDFPYQDTLRALVLAGDRDAREELWSMIRCGRHLLLYSGFDERVFTLDWDFSTLPHWIEELDSNCCRVAGGLESLFQEKLGGSWLYQRPSSGLGEPRSRRVRTELSWSGGRYAWSPLVDRFVARPD